MDLVYLSVSIRTYSQVWFYLSLIKDYLFICQGPPYGFLWHVQLMVIEYTCALSRNPCLRLMGITYGEFVSFPEKILFKTSMVLNYSIFCNGSCFHGMI
jgi:hypothetical protein